MDQLLTQKWKWFVGLGFVSLIIGVLCLIDTVFVTLAMVIILGILLIVAGLAQIIHACYVKGWNSFLWSALYGIIYLIGGILLMREPVSGSVIITVFLGICFCFGGIMRMVIGFNHKGMRGWGLLIFSGILALILGFILFAYPISGLWFIGFMVGFDLIFIGAAWIQLGFTLKSKINPS